MANFTNKSFCFPKTKRKLESEMKAALRKAMTEAFTLIELLFIILTLVALVLLVAVGIPRVRREARQRQCVENLKVVGLAWKIWALDCQDRFHIMVPEANGGALESATNGRVAYVFQVLSNELHEPRVLICPADSRRPIADFTYKLATSNISYFASADASETQPQMFLSGDRSLTINQSPRTGLVILCSNSVAGWSRMLHYPRGNIGLADGTVQVFDAKQLNAAIKLQGCDSNRLAFS